MRILCGTIIAAVLATAANGAEPVSAVGKVSIPSKDRTWKIVYGTSEGPEGRALELLSAELGSIYVRDPGVYTLHVLPCEKAGGGAVLQMQNAILLGTVESNSELLAFVKPGDVPKGGYLVKTLGADGARRIVIAGDTPAAVIWAVSDFLDDGLAALSVEEWDGLRYRSKVFEGGRLRTYESRRAPKTARRSVFMWAHCIDDYRETFRNLARLRFNEVILWNNMPPVNAREVVECAHSWGLSVLWGFAWGWSTNCNEADIGNLDRMGDAILSEWRSTWKPLGGDGIYFQSFTELRKDSIGGKSIAESVVELVNRVAAKVREESPEERIVFGLHAMSVSKRLDVIDRTDKTVEILWEDCGGFPFNYGRPFSPEKDVRLVDAILAEDREVGLVFKCMLVQDWKRFAYQAGPYVLGCASSAVKEEDARMADELWRPYYTDWHQRGRVAYELVHRIQASRPGRSAALNTAVNANGEIRFPFALVAEMFWNADEPYDALVERVMKKTWVK